MKDLILVHTPEFQNWVFNAAHPTQGRRFINARNKVYDYAERIGVDVTEIKPQMPTRGILETVHTPEYVSQVIEQYRCDEWGGQREDLANLAQLFVGATLTALNALLTEETLTAVNFTGAKHHAQEDHSSGFGVFNDFAIAATKLTSKNYRVAILDVDAHHGDGTENLTYWNQDVLTYSIHQYGIFPNTGHADDRYNHVYNLPLIGGADDRKLHLGVRDFIDLTKRFKPDFIFIAAGADGHYDDPLSTLQYSEWGLGHVGGMVRQAFPSMPILIGGAGGYQPDTYTPSVWAHVATQAAATRSLNDLQIQPQLGTLTV